VILVDTSVWVDHFRSSVPHLAAALEKRLVATHAFVIGELALGNLRQRDIVLASLRRLATVPVVREAELLEFIARRSLSGRGIGFVDAHLVAACHLSPGMRLWTRDKRLRSIAEEQGVVATVDP
jgi:predicted nucleic acid-binding protein